LGLSYYNLNLNSPPPAKLTIRASELLESCREFRNDAENQGKVVSYTLVEVMDYECPPCKKQFPLINSLLVKYPDRLRLSIQHYPLSFHKHAVFAAQSAEFARKKGRFWPVHDAIMQLNPLTKEGILKILKEQSIVDFKSDQKDILRVLSSDRQMVSRLGVTGTPSYFLCKPDGSVWQLNQISQLEEIIK
jgi:protein-disulfide isomerase